jgi:bifunctional non-homologous end joining protein LigD
VVTVSNADRVVFPEVSRTKGDVVAYYERVAERILPHLVDRPLSLRRYPKGLAAPGFFQKNVPPHYPKSILRHAVPRSREASKKHKDAEAREQNVTMYPVVTEAEHIPYVANQGAIELHVPTARVNDHYRPDRLVIDLDPPPGALATVRRAAHVVREALGERGLETAPMATGSKGYHVVAAILPTVDGETIALTMVKLATLLVSKHEALLTTVFRVANRGERVFVDWLRNTPLATVVAPYSLRAKPTATVAVPLVWDELDTVAPDAFSIGDIEKLLAREDSLAALEAVDAAPFVAAVDAEFVASGLVLESFDRFRS